MIWVPKLVVPIIEISAARKVFNCIAETMADKSLPPTVSLIEIVPVLSAPVVFSVVVAVIVLLPDPEDTSKLNHDKFSVMVQSTLDTISKVVVPPFTSKVTVEVGILNAGFSEALKPTLRPISMSV